MSDKIQARHLARAACIYVRQSSMRQVRHNLESQRRQYDLSQHARDLGFMDIRVIDEDLGRSGSGLQERPGFARLLAMICEGRLGAVFAIEASRLARNNRDWHHLVDLCGITDTLVVDHDGIYDPRLLNDRLLLGLKGTMSEFELGLFRQRAQEAVRAMLARGEVLRQVPVGYVRTRDKRCEMTADVQVQEAIRGVFTKFRELGTARQVYLWYRHEELALPVIRPSSEGVVWEIPSYARIHTLLKNPMYAGAFVSGRRLTGTVLVGDRTRKRLGRLRSPDQWPVLIRDHHAGYICWDEFLRNQESLKQNSGRSGWMSGAAARRGPALLSGLLRCARCGRRFVVLYCGDVHNRIPRYQCRGNDTRSGGEKCIAFSAANVETQVVDLVLEALAPLAVEASIEAQEQLRVTEETKHRALVLAVERARYEMDHARRQYDCVDPANRLVASELEKRWNGALERLKEAESRLEESTSDQVLLTDAEREQLLTLGRDLEALWYHPATSVAVKKRILRLVLTEIVVDLRDEPREILLWLHWAGGVITHRRFRRRHKGQHRHATDLGAVDLVTELSKLCEDRHIAAALNRAGLKTGKGNSWTRALVCSLRSKRGIPAFDPAAPRTWISQQEAMKELRVSFRTVSRLLRQGILPGRQILPQTPWAIERTALHLPRVQAAVSAIRSRQRAPFNPQAQTQLPLRTRT